jgi:N6-adenosine-specific RNA methylase IME4
VNEMSAPSVFAPLPTVEGGWACVAADPPWAFSTWSARGQDRAPSQHYRDLPPDIVMTLPLQEVLAEDAWLFLWIPDPHLPRLIEVMSAFGFTFSGRAFTWIKTLASLSQSSRWIATDEIEAMLHLGLGKTTRKNSESCWIGRRGKPKILSHSVREVIVSPRQEHSRKPTAFYERIEQFCPGPRLNLFARQTRPGWVGFGTEATKFDQPEEMSL